MLVSNEVHTRRMHVVYLKRKVFSFTVSLSKKKSIVLNYMTTVLLTLILINHSYFFPFFPYYILMR